MVYTILRRNRFSFSRTNNRKLLDSYTRSRVPVLDNEVCNTAVRVLVLMNRQFEVYFLLSILLESNCGILTILGFYACAYFMFLNYQYLNTYVRTYNMAEKLLCSPRVPVPVTSFSKFYISRDSFLPGGLLQKFLTKY